MDEEHITNEELAGMYRYVATQVYIEEAYLGKAIERAKIIKRSNTQIAKFYKKHSTLKNLNIRGIGPETLRILEDLLDLGECLVVDNEVRKRRGRWR